MFTLDWSQERPSFEDSQRIWDRPVFSLLDPAQREPTELLMHARAICVNGGACFARFSVAQDTRIDWFVSRNRIDEISFVEQFLRSSALAEALPALRPNDHLGKVKWEWITPYILDGELAGLLKAGGAYKSYAGSGLQAKEIGFNACAELFDHRYEDILLYRTHSRWSDWFYDVAWDYTWVAVDKAERAVWVLCITDTD